MVCLKIIISYIFNFHSGYLLLLLFILSIFIIHSPFIVLRLISYMLIHIFSSSLITIQYHPIHFIVTLIISHLFYSFISNYHLFKSNLLSHYSYLRYYNMIVLIHQFFNHYGRPYLNLKIMHDKNSDYYQISF